MKPNPKFRFLPIEGGLIETHATLHDGRRVQIAEFKIATGDSDTVEVTLTGNDGETVILHLPPHTTKLFAQSFFAVLNIPIPKGAGGHEY